MIDKSKIPFDLSKITKLGEKIDLKSVKGLMGNVKSMMGVGAAEIPADAKDDPIGYRYNEIAKYVKALIEMNTSQTEIINKIVVEMGELNQLIKGTKSATPTAGTTETKPTESTTQ
jgi:hypothetical protein